MTKTIQPVPDDNRSHKGPGSEPTVVIDDTKGHRDDEKHNIREQAAHGNLTQNTSHRRSADGVFCAASVMEPRRRCAVSPANPEEYRS
jgi:hypothetical protein